MLLGKCVGAVQCLDNNAAHITRASEDMASDRAPLQGAMGLHSLWRVRATIVRFRSFLFLFMFLSIKGSLSRCQFEHIRRLLDISAHICYSSV